MSMEMPNRRLSISCHWSVLAGFALVLLGVACNPSKSTPPAEAGPRTFATPDDAGAALLTAVKTADHNDLLAIFGPGSADLIFSGDDAEDKRTGEHFIKAYQTMNRWRKQTDGSEALVVGADNFLFPIPLRKNSSGQWYFDTMAGKDEILKQRIGDNELATIDVMNALVDAQAQYFSQHNDGVKQYAQRFVSDDGKQNGLYWKTADGQTASPLGPLVAAAASDGFTPQAGKQEPFHGYLYRILYKQGAVAKGGAKDFIVDGKMTGGFAFIAYPETYGDTGITTFITNQSGVVYEKDLGKNTATQATTTTEFNPDKSWTTVPE
jgi:Protein of unknown function (DUF2950)